MTTTTPTRIDHALSGRTVVTHDWRGYPVHITRREEEVLQAVVDGCSTPQVAARLYLSQKTVKNHLASIYQKLDARDRTQAVLIALRLGIVALDGPAAEAA